LSRTPTQASPLSALTDLVRHQRDVLLDFFLVELTADQALDSEQRVLRVGHGLALGRRADEDLAVFLVGDDRRRSTGAFRILDDLRLTIFHDRHAGVGGAQVDTDDSAHNIFSFFGTKFSDVSNIGKNCVLSRGRPAELKAPFRN
jgi:hypothetical protein